MKSGFPDSQNEATSAAAGRVLQARAVLQAADTNKSLVTATWVLAVATILLAVATIVLVVYTIGWGAS